MSEKRECFCRLFLREDLHVHDCPDAPKPEPRWCNRVEHGSDCPDWCSGALKPESPKSNTEDPLMDMEPPKTTCLPDCRHTPRDWGHSQSGSPKDVASKPRKSGRTMTLQTQTPGGQDVASEPEDEPDFNNANRDAQNIVDNFEPQDCDENEYNLALAYLSIQKELREACAENAALKAQIEECLSRWNAEGDADFALDAFSRRRLDK